MKHLLALLMLAGCYGGGPRILLDDQSVYGFGSVVSTTTCDNDAYTGWMSTHNVSEIVLHITHSNDADGATNTDMTCEGTNDATEANGAGFEICSQSTATGVSTYTCPNTWRISNNAAREWMWSVNNVHRARYINCLFDCGSDADDDIAVSAFGVYP